MCVVSVRSQSQTHTGVSGRLTSQDDDVHQQETDPLFLPQLNKLHETSLVRGEDASNVVVIPTQSRKDDTPDPQHVSTL